MIYHHWLVWISLFTFVTIGVLLIKKPYKGKRKNGDFDNPIHTKPVFKYASLTVLILVSFIFFIEAS